MELPKDFALPESDERYLKEKGYAWQLLCDDEGVCLVIEKYPVSGELYDRSGTDLMIRIPPQYNNAALDMFYADPPLRMKGTDKYPDRADSFIDRVKRRWQQFSRHFPVPWRPGVDGLPTLLTFVQRELHGKKGPLCATR